jgi:glucokinase
VSGTYAGIAIAMLIDILNPQIIILGSLYERCQDLLKPVLFRTLETEALARPLAGCRVVPISLGDQIGDYAAISVALYDMARADANHP